MNTSIKPDADLQFKTGDANSYNEVADYFDKYTEMFTRHLPHAMLELVSLQPDHQVLDIGTGTGVVALQVAEQLENGGSVTGIDLSDGMLGIAGKKAENTGLADRARFTRMDAEKLEFDNDSFDTVLSLYALRHFPNPEKAVREIYRVLRNGGRVVVAVGSRPPLMSGEGIRAALRRIASIVRKSTGRELAACEFIDRLVNDHLPQSKSPETAQWTGHRHGFTGSTRQLLETAGFRDIRSTWKGQYSIIESAEDFWLLQMTFSSLARKRIAQADRSQVKKLKDEFTRQCEQVLSRHGRLVYQSGAAIVSGLKQV